MASKIEVVKIRQCTVFPRGVVSFFSSSKKTAIMCLFVCCCCCCCFLFVLFFVCLFVCFWQKHYECNYRNKPDDRQCYGKASQPLDSKTHLNRLFAILPIVLHKQLVEGDRSIVIRIRRILIGFWNCNYCGFFPRGRKMLDTQMELKTSRVNKLSGSLVSSL